MSGTRPVPAHVVAVAHLEGGRAVWSVCCWQCDGAGVVRGAPAGRAADAAEGRGRTVRSAVAHARVRHGGRGVLVVHDAGGTRVLPLVTAARTPGHANASSTRRTA